ncbi:MAG: DUF1015 family protein, partial [Kiritimatiellia bacterium]|nr:DUF1015 family protein [Kiritimatiellia bacterium]
IADGHHRAAAAARVARERGTVAAGFLATLFPAESLRICGYHRCVTDLNGLRSEAFLEKVSRVFRCREDVAPEPPRRGEAVFWLGDRSFRLQWPTPSPSDPVEALDVSVLQNRLFAPLLGIKDARKDPRLLFVGGLNGAEKVRRLVETGGAAAGWVLAPCSINDLMSISDIGRVMPPKSTWFEPKLRSGLLVHVLDELSPCG